MQYLGIIVVVVLAVAFMYMKNSKPHGGATKVFSDEMVDRNAAVICDKGDPLNIPGGVFRVLSSNKIARYPNPPIASSWDPNWGAAVRVDCTGATAAPNMEMKA
jgi:hypothetical protein